MGVKKRGYSIDYIFYMLAIPWWFYIIAIGSGIVAGKATKKWTYAILICYMALLLAQTVLFRDASENAQYKLTLFWSYKVFKKENLNWNNIMFIKQIALNIIVFIPIGVVAAIETGFRGISFGISFSFFIEALQLITQRGDVERDDIINNTIVTVIGVLITICISWLRRNIKNSKTV
ncbi:MAG: VanZ family protein [Oscillospiraceae bacterium]|nr:VanZ family protein [Oscillospiraceae bacterium]